LNTTLFSDGPIESFEGILLEPSLTAQIELEDEAEAEPVVETSEILGLVTTV